MSNKKKSMQLGMPYGTATQRLRKMVLFKLLQDIGQDVCFQCGERILTVEELSMEHKVPWLNSDDPVGLFFDVDNISFSHLSCNARASAKLTEDDVQEIRRLLSEGVSLRVLGKRFNVTHGTIFRIKKGEAWGHLAGVA